MVVGAIVGGDVAVAVAGAIVVDDMDEYVVKAALALEAVVLGDEMVAEGHGAVVEAPKDLAVAALLTVTMLVLKVAPAVNVVVDEEEFGEVVCSMAQTP